MKLGAQVYSTRKSLEESEPETWEDTQVLVFIGIVDSARLSRMTAHLGRS
jgi:hypothetical protein